MQRRATRAVGHVEGPRAARGGPAVDLQGVVSRFDGNLHRVARRGRAGVRTARQACGGAASDLSTDRLVDDSEPCRHRAPPRSASPPAVSRAARSPVRTPQRVRSGSSRVDLLPTGRRRAPDVTTEGRDRPSATAWTRPADVHVAHGPVARRDRGRATRSADAAAGACLAPRPPTPQPRGHGRSAGSRVVKEASPGPPARSPTSARSPRARRGVISGVSGGGRRVRVSAGCRESAVRRTDADQRPGPPRSGPEPWLEEIVRPGGGHHLGLRAPRPGPSHA